MLNAINHFTSRGGNYIAMKDNTKLYLKYIPGVTEFKPYCSAGTNRSAVTREYLINTLQSNNTSNYVYNQHAGDNGACPVHDCECLIIPAKTATENDEFSKAFGSSLTAISPVLIR